MGEWQGPWWCKQHGLVENSQRWTDDQGRDYHDVGPYGCCHLALTPYDRRRAASGISRGRDNRIWAGKVADSLVHIWKETRSLEEVTDAVEGVLNGAAPGVVELVKAAEVVAERLLLQLRDRGPHHENCECWDCLKVRELYNALAALREGGVK